MHRLRRTRARIAMSENENTAQKNTTAPASGDGSPKKRRAGKIVALVAFVVFSCLAIGLLINALLAVFVPHYYPTFGEKRLFSIVTDSMEPTIPAGSMIVSRKPKNRDEIKEGTVITFEVKTGNDITLLTHRVVAVNTAADGGVTYTTRGDNAGGVDPVRPSYADIVGIYTGSKCGVFGYVFGFLQSPEGAIALILIVTVCAMAYIVVRLVNVINMWRTAAADALKQSGSMLAETENAGLGVIADVIGIAVKEPRDRAEAKRKDKKLEWFIKTGSLPKRPYADDLDVAAEMQDSIHAGSVPPTPPAPSVYVKEPFAQMRCKVSYRARVIMLADEKKEWYSALKNALMRYPNIRCAESNKGERFILKRKTLAQFSVRGKTLRLTLAVPPTDGKDVIAAADGRSLLKITSNRRCAAAVKLIDGMMRELGIAPRADYIEQDYFVPYEGPVSLMRRGLIVRDLKRSQKIYRVEEMPKEAAPQQPQE